MSVQKKISLKSFHTFGHDVISERFVEVRTFAEFLSFSSEKEILILGEGSNLLFKNDWNGIVIKNSIQGIRKLNQSTILVKSGVAWKKLIRWCERENLWGLENLSGIPGSVGASVVQNIGAYGVEVCEFVKYVRAWDFEKQCMITLRLSDLQFGYRMSLFKKNPRRFFIYEVCYSLSMSPFVRSEYGNLSEVLSGSHTLQTVRTRIESIRSAKLPDPDYLGNAGSYFKNPVVSQKLFNELQSKFQVLKGFPVEDGIKLSAAQLIDLVEGKSINIGGAKPFKKQPLIIVSDKGKSQDVLAVALEIKERVKKKFGIDLVEEVEIL